MNDSQEKAEQGQLTRLVEEMITPFDTNLLVGATG